MSESLENNSTQNIEQKEEIKKEEKKKKNSKDKEKNKEKETQKKEGNLIKPTEDIKDKKSADKIKKCIKIKTGIVFGISALLIILFWYYVSAFCCVFKNSQGQYFLNVAGAFILCNIWPFVTSLLSPPLRIYGIKHKSPCAYKASQIIAYI